MSTKRNFERALRLSTRCSSVGFTLLELMIVLVISAVALALFIRQQYATNDVALVTSAAAQLTEIGIATQSFITANSPATGAIAISQLQAAGSCSTKPCLASSFFAAPPGTAAGNSYLVNVVRTGSSPSFAYSATIITAKPWMTGSQIRLDLAGAAARIMGGSGLVSYAPGSMESEGQSNSINSPAVVVANCPGLTQVGQFGYFISGTGTASLDLEYVRLDGQYPMTGSLKMGGNDVLNANNVTANGTLTAANVNATNNLTAAAAAVSGNSSFNTVTTTGAVVTNGTLTANGAVTTTGSLVAGGTVTLNNTLTANNTITANGAIAANSTVTVASGGDVIMNSLAGANKSLTARISNVTVMASQGFDLKVGHSTDTVAMPSCSGGTPGIQLTNNVAYGDINGSTWGLSVLATAAGSSWTISLTSGTGGSGPTNDDHATGVAITYCAFV